MKLVHSSNYRFVNYPTNIRPDDAWSFKVALWPARLLIVCGLYGLGFLAGMVIELVRPYL